MKKGTAKIELSPAQARALSSMRNDGATAATSHAAALGSVVRQGDGAVSKTTASTLQALRDRGFIRVLKSDYVSTTYRITEQGRAAIAMNEVRSDVVK